jgi:hypothetical protein
MKRNLIKTVFIIFFLFILQFTGCTAIGFGLGVISDSKKPDEKVIYLNELTKVKKGTPIRIIQKDKEEIQGILSGYAFRDEKEYMEVYNESRQMGSG